MTNSKHPVDQHVDEMLSGYLDGELTQQQKQRVDLHLEQCEACGNNLRDLAALRERMGRARLVEDNSDRWRETMEDTTVKVSLGIGWLLVIGGLLIIAGVGLYHFVTDPSIGWGMKLMIGAPYVGMAALFVAVLRQRLVERKTDKYKNVEI
jgi:hypothetical protein